MAAKRFNITIKIKDAVGEPTVETNFQNLEEYKGESMELSDAITAKVYEALRHIQRSHDQAGG